MFYELYSSMIFKCSIENTMAKWAKAVELVQLAKSVEYVKSDKSVQWVQYDGSA